MESADGYFNFSSLCLRVSVGLIEHRDTETQRKQIMIRTAVVSALALIMAAVFAAWRTTAMQGVPQAKVEGCVSCHGMIEPRNKYGTTEPFEKLKAGKDAVGLSCTACHGGNPASVLKEEAHVKPLYPREWGRAGGYSSANPERSNTLMNRESWEFVRFVNPGDLRVAATTCGSSSCHQIESKNVARSMMTNGAMLWGAALYNNGSFHLKDPRFGESYSEGGEPQTLLQTVSDQDRSE